MSGSDVEEDQTSLRFFPINGKTLYGQKGHLFGDFTLKVIGKINLAKDSGAGHWVCTCGTKDRGTFVTRMIVLNVNCLDTKQKFIDGLRASYGGGTFLLGPRVTAPIIHLYAVYLKADYEEQEEPRLFWEPTYMGYQGDAYWIVSNKLHIKHGKVLSSNDHQYIALDESLNGYQLNINQRLLQIDTLSEALTRFSFLTNAFGQNAVAFQLATAFTVGRIIRNAAHPGDVWAESSLGMVFSVTKCIGKSLSLLLLALGEGIPSRVHLMFLSGGNQLMCGTSSKKMQQSLARTTGVVMIDDPDISKPFSEFLLQVQGRLLSGSNKEGMSSPRAAALISTNSPELARLVGRVIRFNYTGQVDGQPSHNSQMLSDFVPFMEKNRGLLLAWAILYFDLWEQVFHGSMNVIVRVLVNSLKDFNMQERWLKGVATVVLSNALVNILLSPLPHTY